jgi:hypothetical protein
MVKPRLPYEIEQSLPQDVVNVIYSYVPHVKKVSPKSSPSLQKELTRIQSMNLRGKSPDYMRGLDDFVLDRYYCH